MTQEQELKILAEMHNEAPLDWTSELHKLSAEGLLSWQRILYKRSPERRVEDIRKINSDLEYFDKYRIRVDLNKISKTN